MYALGTADQQWILSQLDDAERQQLECYLKELQSLGIPADPELASTIIRPEVKPTLAHPALSDTALRFKEQLDEIPMSHIISVLRQEPGWMLVPLLRLGPWPWQASLLSSLDEDRRVALVSALHAESPVPAEFALALLKALQTKAISLPKQLDRSAPEASAGAPSPLLRWVRKWLP
ncbi:hypothetical protein [Chitinivorax tropicus]|uniref:hypothetical protein n=1 Tax=Chitinivorax tropicus TaxID=714531 RepID=UPI0016158C48|nr:hypothetical protein [Chitinivorax tropicus]